MFFSSFDLLLYGFAHNARRTSAMIVFQATELICCFFSYGAFRYRAALFSQWKQRGMYAGSWSFFWSLVTQITFSTMFLSSMWNHWQVYCFLWRCFFFIHNESIYPREFSSYYLCRWIVSMHCEGVILLLFPLHYFSCKGQPRLYVLNHLDASQFIIFSLKPNCTFIVDINSINY